jgi:hypothetical protein
MDSFLNVRPTGAPINETVGKWTQSEQEHAAKLWRTQMRGDAPVKDDTAITDADIAANNLVLWGDPQSNKVLARIADKLPIHWTADAIVLGARRFPAATSAPVMIYPNPLNPKKYIVINSRPDYAVVDLKNFDLTAPPDPRWPGKVAVAGFFGEKWELLANDGQ